MSLYRWSLPSRAFYREKSSDSDSNRSTKFSTIHIGQPGTRRRANLSALFATLFEKNENNQDNSVPSDTRSSGSQAPPSLESRTENIPHAPNFKSCHVKELQTTTPNGVEPQQTNDLSKPYIAQWDSIPQALRNPLCPRSDTFSWVLPQQVESLSRTNSTRLNSKGDNPNNGKEKGPMELVNLSDCLDRARSTSSSYPTEGIRSPPDHCRSPEPTTLTHTLVSEYSRIGDYMAQEAWCRSSELTNDTSCPDSALGKNLIEELAAAGSVSDTDSRTTGQDQTNKCFLPIVSPRPVVETEEISSPQQCPHPDVFKESNKENYKHSSSSDCMVPILKNGDSYGSTLNISFMAYKTPVTVGTSDDDAPSNISRVNSTDRLRASIDTNSTSCTTIRDLRETSRSDTMATSFLQNTRTPTSLRSATLVGDCEQPTLCLPEPSRPAGSLARRIQQFRFKKWVKKVCLRTRVRFEHAVKPGRSPMVLAASSSSKRGPSKARHGKKPRTKAKKGAATLFWWDPTRTGARNKRQQLKRTQKSKEEARQFLNSFKARKSFRPPATPTPDGGPLNNHDVYHKRVQSCPAHAGL
ncbi:hypothetical protein F5X96DRAFT_635388 [Biscogniauxia mediterranea]|nr:hypothetical protein F5X96DRAFT_635388 [Biscogniauxia mediterranea]